MVSDREFKDISTAVSIKEDMDRLMVVYGEIVKMRPYGDFDEVQRFNRELEEVGNRLAAMHLRASIALGRVQVDTGVIGRDEFRHKSGLMLGVADFATKALREMEERCDLKPIEELPPEEAENGRDSEENEYRIQE